MIGELPNRVRRGVAVERHREHEIAALDEAGLRRGDESRVRQRVEHPLERILPGDQRRSA